MPSFFSHFPCSLGLAHFFFFCFALPFFFWLAGLHRLSGAVYGGRHPCPFAVRAPLSRGEQKLRTAAECTWCIAGIRTYSTSININSDFPELNSAPRQAHSGVKSGSKRLVLVILKGTHTSGQSGT